MKVLIINSVCGIGSTGKICIGLARDFMAKGDEVRIAYGRKSPIPEQFQHICIRIGSDMNCRIQGLQTRLLDAHGFGSKRATRAFLNWAEAYHPDLLWLHNLHGYYINVEMLFDWIKQHPDLQVRWTLHDCWAFTGHCSYFTMAGCSQWKEQCVRCPQLREYPACYGKGAVQQNFERKRRAFTGVRNLTLITPSQWMADLTKQSFLGEYPVEVHYNTIDTTVFKPTASDFREKYGLQQTYVILGVAFIWDERKGLEAFLELAQMLDERYAIVLVGLSDKQVKSLPEQIPGIRPIQSPQAGIRVFASTTPTQEAAQRPADQPSAAVPQDVNAIYQAITGCKWTGQRHTVGRLICIPRTGSAQELAAIYTAADVYVNPTKEDNFPTVNLEAQACGTRVITYDTGGCRETLR